MKFKIVMLKPGTVLSWKEYSLFTRLYNKLRGRQLPDNKFAVLLHRTELLTNDSFPITAYEPIRKYSKQELTRLGSLFYVGEDNWDTISYAINLVRPNTFTNADSIDNCKYYIKRDLNAESSEYIF